MAAARDSTTRSASAPCHACLLRGGEKCGPNARASWRRICDDCAEDYMSPLLVPGERVRLCPEGVGSWGQSREIFQSWDTGLGATVPARKYNLKPTPDGNVAVVFQDASDADTIDRLLGPLAVRPERPLALRYCSSIKSFCADTCFASTRDKSCLSHVKPRRAQEKLEREARAEQSNLRKPADMEIRAADDESWLFDDILAPANDYGADDGLSMQSLSDIYEPILDVSGLAEGEGDTLESLLNGDRTSTPQPPPVRTDSLSTVATQSLAERSEADQLADTKQQRALNALWNEGADSNNIMNSLSSLLCPDMDPAQSFVDPTHELWAASAVEVLDETYKTYNKGLAQGAGLKPKAKLGRPPLTVKPATPKQSKPPAPAGPSPKVASKPGTPIVKKSQSTPKIQTMKVSTLSQQQSGSTPKASSTPKSKCVWKQLVTYW